MRWGTILTLLAATLLAACSNDIEVEPPPRVEDQPVLGNQTSTMQVPLQISLDEVQRALEARTPRRLWRMNERRSDCIPATRVNPLGLGFNVTPNIACTIIGEANRGRIRLTGSGNRLTIRVPVNATLRAEDIGDIISGETADASADVIINARLSMTDNWGMRADLDLDYSWSEEPGIDFLGQRINFTERVDEELDTVIRDIERELERTFARISARPLVEDAWQKGFTTVSLNAENPPAWLRITPQRLGVTGYDVQGRSLSVNIALEARTETMIGERPDPVRPGPLPAMARDFTGDGVLVAVPVIVDYAQLEPVLLRELGEFAEGGITLPRIGVVDAAFSDVEIYATQDRRIAVGINASVTPREGVAARYGEAQGQIWLTGEPYNAANSAVISIRNLTIHGDTDRNTVDLLIALFADEQVRSKIEAALVGDFTRDYDRIIADAREAVSELQTDGVTLNLTIDEVRHGRVRATGAGLFLPVEVEGSGRLRVTLSS
ncbi:DUF4403 family protein [Aurantiacibacter sediminis]|uniref:DUF4403 family protein n=1 Tax=Aurantiacibacter sediminis TaxID=2793064 RepID=A0ABS0N0K7_9SPHN|nr:DUF4403 family protein [Aurantiacibacter sediminis]MBH5321502.1 DUF4403 family protein [Aurantiacibacter sediminis]